MDGRLPPALELAREYGISTASVREALRFLESIGIVTLSHGRGIFVESRTEIVEELLRTREVIECSNVREAALNCSEEDINRLNTILSNMDKAIVVDNVNLYSRLDTELHLAISDLAKNRILKKILENIRLLMYYQQLAVNSIPAVLKESHAKHHLIVEAIIAGDAAGAEKTIKAHLEQVNQTWKSNTKQGMQQ